MYHKHVSNRATADTLREAIFPPLWPHKSSLYKLDEIQSSNIYNGQLLYTYTQFSKTRR